RDPSESGLADLARASRVEAGQREQVLREGAHAFRILLDAFHRLRGVFLRLHRAHAIQLGVSANADERRTQLVARVADETTHLDDGRVAFGERLVDAVEHRVDGDLEATDLRRRLDLGSEA